MIRTNNAEPTTVSFVQKGDDKNASAIAKSQIARLSRDEVVAAGQVETANYHLVKATEALKSSEIAYFTAVEKAAPNVAELRKAYNNALAGHRDADKAVRTAGETLNLAKSALAGVLAVAKGQIENRYGQMVDDDSSVPKANDTTKIDDIVEVPPRMIMNVDGVMVPDFSLTKRAFSAEKRQALASAGKALPDGSFPIENKGDLANAIQAVGRAKNPAQVKAHIITQAKALGATDAIPESWTGADSSMTKSIERQIAKGAVLVLCPSCMSGDDSSCPMCQGMNDGMVPQSWVTGNEDGDYEDDSSADDSTPMAKAFSTESLLTREFEKSAGFLSYIAKGGPGSGAQDGHTFNGNQWTGGIKAGANLMHEREGWKNTIKRYNTNAAEMRKEADSHVKAGDIASRAGDHRTAADHYRAAAKSYMKAQGTQKGNEMVMRLKADEGHPDASHTEANAYQENARTLRTLSAGASAKADAEERALAQTA